MGDTGNTKITPGEAYAAIEEGFFGVLGERAPELEGDIRARQGGIEDRHAAWVEDEQSRFHLRFAALALAGYRVLLSILSEDEALSLVRRALIEPRRR